MAVKQYPYYLFVHNISESTQDPNTGNWSTPSDDWVFHSVCREETNGAGRQINGQDGEAIIFSSVVYLPSTAASIAEGTEVFVSETNSKEAERRICKHVLKFNKGQLNSRLWL